MKSHWKKQDGYEIAAIMARLPDWERPDERKPDRADGRQRAFRRKPGADKSDKYVLKRDKLAQ